MKSAASVLTMAVVAALGTVAMSVGADPTHKGENDDAGVKRDYKNRNAFFGRASAEGTVPDAPPSK